MEENQSAVVDNLVPAQIPASTVPALATTKRKFHKLLENLTKTPSGNKRSLDKFSSTDSPAKRIRLEARSRLEAEARFHARGVNAERAPLTAAEERNARVQAQLLTSRLEAAKYTRLSSHEDESGGSLQKEPNYVPWSHVAFLDRLQTFSDLLRWSSKPDAVNEVVWAKRGWVCVDHNTVCCQGGCEERVAVGLRPPRKDELGNVIAGSEDFAVEISEQLVEKVSELVIGGHAEGCLWRSHGCKDDIYRLPMTHQAVWQPELQARFSSFAPYSSHLPSMSRLHAPADIPRLLQLLRRELASVTSDKTNPTNEILLSFSTYGWTVSEESTPEQPIGTCKACFRRLGLWLYTDPCTIDLDTAPLPKLDLVTSHRTYCPWINAQSQHQTTGSLSGLCGWEVLVKSIENAAAFRASGEDDGASYNNKSLISEGDEQGGEGTVGDGKRPSNSSSMADNTATTTPARSRAQSIASTTYMEKSKEELEREDKARFAKLRELSRSIGLKGLRAKLSRAAYK